MLTGIIKTYPSFDIGGAGEGTGEGGAPAGGAAGEPGEGAGGEGSEGQPSGTPGDGSAEDPEHEITVDGQAQRVKLSELRAGYSRHADYTRKTQALADRQRQLEDDYRQRISSIQERQQRQGQPPAEGEGEGDPNPSAEIASLREQMADDKLERTLRDLKSEFPTLNEDQFCLLASKRGVERFEDLRTLAKEHCEAIGTEQNTAIEAALKNPDHPLTKKYRDTWLKEYLAGKGGEPSHDTGSNGGPQPGQVAPAKKRMSFDEADEAARAALDRA